MRWPELDHGKHGQTLPTSRNGDEGSGKVTRSRTRGKRRYPPESAARDELRLGAQGLGNELIVVGILGTVPAPAAG